MMYFYDKIPDMECLAGDTLPVFTVTVDTSISLSGCRMQLILANHNSPETAVLVKECTRAGDNTFQVQLTSEDTQLIEDIYDLHFRFIDSAGISSRKLKGTLYIRAAAEGD